MANRPAPRIMTVLGTRRISPAMHRVTLGGEGMADYPPRQQGGYVKVMLAPAPGGSKPIVRTYTIRHQRDREMDVDFALHGEAAASGDTSAGPATEWATSVRAGETIEIGGPGPAKPLPEGFDHYLIAGDMTALPAIAVNLEALPDDAKGVAVIEVQSEADQQDLIAPPGLEIRWLINDKPGQRPELLPDAVRAIDWPETRVYGWVACEFSSMRLLRTYLREERGLGADRLYISSYWKSGLVEDAHKVIKREDSEAELARA